MSDFWQCPKCHAVLQKGLSGGMAPRGLVVGTATCGGCGARFAQSDVYGGKFDVHRETVTPREGARPRDRITNIVIIGLCALVFAGLIFMAIYRSFVPPQPEEPLQIKPAQRTNPPP